MNFIFLLTYSSSCAQNLNDSPSNLMKNMEKYDFRNIFEKMIFKIPDFTFFADSTKFMLYNIYLYAFDINYLNISYLPDTSNSLLLKLQIESGTANATVFIENYGVSIKIMAQINNLTLFLPIQYFKGDDELIENITLIEDIFYSHLDNIDIKIDSVLISFVEKYIPVLKKSIFELLNDNTNFYSLLNELIENYGGQLFEKINTCIRSDINKQEKIKIPISNQNEILPIIQSPIVDFLRYILNDHFLKSSSPFNLNNIVNKIVDDYDCLKLTRIGEEFKFDVPIVIKVQEAFNFIINEISITGLNTWSNLSFLNPNKESQYELDSSASLGDIKINISTELKFSLIDIDNEYSQSSYYTQKISLFIELVNNSIEFDFQIAFPKNASSNYTNSQFLDTDCLLKLVEFNESGINNLHINTTFNNFSYQIENEDFFFGLIKFIFDEIIEKNKKIIPKFLNGLVYEIFIKKAIEKGKEATCSNEKVHSESEMDLQVTLISFGISLLLGIILSIIVLIHSKKDIKKKKDKTKEKKKNEYEDDKGRIEEELINEPKTKSLSKLELFLRTDENASLMMNPNISLWIRLIIPFLIFTNIALFISSNTAWAASIIIKFLFGEKQNVYLPSVFDFSLLSSVKRLWDVKKYFLAILICTMSFIWPFVKLIIMIIVWILPLTILKFKTRSQILSVLNVLGKWSLLDSYLVIMMVLAFHLRIQFPIYNTKDIDIPIRLNVFVYPAYGFITLILGTLMSLTISHIICSINRKTYKNKNENNGEKEESTIKFSIYKSQKLIMNIFCVIFLVVTLITFSIGLYLKSNSFNVSGYVGWFMDILEKETEHSFSPIDIGIKYSKSVEKPNVFIVRFTQIIFFFLTIVIPFIHIISLFLLLFVPLSKKYLLHFYYFNETLYAWSCLDVFFVSIITSHLVIPQVYLNAKECGYFRPIAKQYTIRGHGKCFEVVAKIRYGPYLLLTASVFYTIANILIFMTTKKLATRFEMNEDETKNNKELEIIDK